jgi:hypothetical protein
LSCRWNCLSFCVFPFGPLYCLSFIHSRLLIKPLVSTNFPHNMLCIKNVIALHCVYLIKEKLCFTYFRKHCVYLFKEMFVLITCLSRQCSSTFYLQFTCFNEYIQ